MPAVSASRLPLDRRSLLRGGAGMVAATGLAGFPLASALAASREAAPWPHVRAMIDSYISQRKVANMVAAMGWKQQSATTISRGNLAFGGAMRADPDSLYRIYSMTKPITGMATMILIDEGKLGLDQPLAEILPAFARMQVQKRYDGPITPDNLEPVSQPITIRQLLTHTSGLGYTITQQGPIKAAYEAQGLVPGQVTRLPIPGLFDARPVQGLKAFADRLAKMPLVHQPGSKWSYSVSFDLLGRVIEVASGKAFDAFLQERIFEPCGMTNTGFSVSMQDMKRLTTNYGVLGSTVLPLDPAAASIFLDKPPFPFGGSGLVSTARDYDRFLRMLLGLGAIDGQRVMSEKAVRMGVSNLLPEGASTKGTLIDGHGFGAGGRVSDGVYGWGGAAGSIGFVSFTEGLRATLMTQYMPVEAYGVHDDFPLAVIADLAALKEAA